MGRRHSPLTAPPESLMTSELFELEAWALSHPDHEWAAPHVAELAEACLDHFRGTGELRADWMATIRTWIRRTPAYSTRSAAGVGSRAAPASWVSQRDDATKDAARSALSSMARRRGLRVEQ